MTASIPTLEQCLCAAERMNLRSKRTRKGTPTGRGLQFQVYRPASRVLEKEEQQDEESGPIYSTGRVNEPRAGALLIAADDDISQVNPALLRASALQHGYVYLRDTESFSEAVSYLALQMLRVDWRHDEHEVSRDCAEQAAASMRTPWWSEGSD